MSDAVDRQARWDAVRAWTAERGAGPWAALRDASRFCRIPPSRVARTLSMLGHIELSWDTGRWAAAPSCLAELEEPPGRLLLTGALCSDLPERVDDALARHGIDAAVVGPFAEGGRGPSSWHVEVHPSDQAAAAEACGLPLVRAAARRIAARLPAGELRAIAAAHLVDDRFPAAPLDPDTLRPAWGRPVQPGQPAIQLLPGDRPVWWVLHPDGTASRLPSGEWAAWLAARGGESRATHDPDGTLRVDAAAPLPPLHARAACLCAGRLPGRAHSAPQTAEDRYRAVPPQVASMIITTLTDGGEAP